MASNRFAALSPDFEEEEVKRRQQAEEQKKKKEAMLAKAEEKPKGRPERMHEGPQGERHYPGERGRGRGIRRPYRGRGGFPRGGDVDYAPKDKSDFPREQKEFRFTGSTDAVHPFDRRSGTGRGTEVPKRGMGKGNWGNPSEDWRNEQNAEEERKPEVEDKAAVAQEGAEPAKEGEAKKEGEGEQKYMNKRDKRRQKKGGDKEEKEEEPLDADGSALTFKEYQAMVADKQKGLPSKKTETQITRDPKAASGLVAYAKTQYSGLSAVAKAGKKKAEEPKTEEAKEPSKVEVLGAYIAEEFRRAPIRGDKGKIETRAEETAPAEGERRQPYHRGRGGYKGQHPAAEEKREQHPASFQMKEDDFPTFK